MSETSELLTGGPVAAPAISGRGRSRVLAGAAAGCVVGFTAVYFGFVWTRAGQAFEFDVLKGSPALLDTPAVLRARSWLAYVTEYVLAGVVVLVLAIGLLRRRPALALLGAAVIVVTAGVDRVLVRWVFTRPPLVVDPMSRENSFPSGHVAMAMSALLGLLIVVPYAWRGVTALVGSGFVLGVAEMTMTVGWHRLSDTVGGNLLALGVACAGLAVLVSRSGVWMPLPGRRVLSLLLAVIPLLGYVVWTIVAAVGPAAEAHAEGGSEFEYRSALFQVAGGAATVFSTLIVVAFLVLLARIEPARISRRRPGVLAE
jgi:membrane-associated phospholipid phosphatase